MEEKKFIYVSNKRDKISSYKLNKIIFICNFSATKGHKTLKQKDNITPARKSQVLQKYHFYTFKM